MGGHYISAAASSGSPNHGCPESNATIRHTGDTGNWNVDAVGAIDQTKTLDLIALTGGRSVVGMGLIVHAFTDNCVTVPSSMARIGQGTTLLY